MPRSKDAFFMPATPFWKQSRTERAATLDAVFGEMTPADLKSPTAKSQLRLIQALVLKKRSQGYNHDQIAAGLKDQRIGIDVTPAYVRSILREGARDREKRRKARVAATIAAAQKLTAAAPVASKPASPAAPKS